MPLVAASSSINNTQPGIASWLEERGFSANPFEFTNAEFEQDLLPRYYIDLGELDTLLANPKPYIIFAARGCGKTAQRQMLASMCRPGNPHASHLAVHYTYEGFERAFFAAGEDMGKVKGYHHIEAILYAGIAALVQSLQADPQALKTLCLPENRSLLAAYLAKYAPGALGFPTGAGQEAPLKKLTPTQQLHSFADLLVKAGFHNGMIFIDGLDEFPETAGNLDQAVIFLTYLMGTLRIIETPGLTFRFFLSDAMKPILRQQSWFRADRIGVTTIDWNHQHLVSLVQQRLTYFSQQRRPPYEGLAQLCDEKLAPIINTELFTHARSQPRSVLQLANELIKQHTTQADPPDLIELHDWELIKQKFPMKNIASPIADIPAALDPGTPIPPEKSVEPSAPLLTIDPEKSLVWLGKIEIRNFITPQDYILLLCLYEKKESLSSKDYLAGKAWGMNDHPIAIHDQTIATSIGRLRKVLKKHSGGWEYIDNVRGDRLTGGYRLFPRGLPRSSPVAANSSEVEENGE